MCSMFPTPEVENVVPDLWGGEQGRAAGGAVWRMLRKRYLQLLILLRLTR